VNTIVGIRSQQDCRISHQSVQENIFLNRNYASTLATSNPRRERQHQTSTSSTNSLSTKTRQRSKIRTNPWIKTTRTSQVEYPINDPILSPGLIHSESFPQIISNGNIHSTNPSNIILHQSDSGQGFSLSSSRMIDSSSPDNTSTDGQILDEKHRREQYYFPKTNPSDNKRRGKKSVQPRYQRPSNTRIVTSPKKHPYQARSSSPRLHHDHFSAEFEDIVENERLNKQRSPSRMSPFILPLDETNIPSSTIGTLKKTNSHTILKHIEEIENEIRMMKNLNLDPEEQIFSSNNDERQSIHEQVDQWIEECLTTTKHNPPTLLHNQCDRLSNAIQDYVVCVYSNKNYQTSSLPKPPKQTELMTAFYLSSIPTTKGTFSSNFQTIEKDFKSTHECPF
jgi:hypothetical protein